MNEIKWGEPRPLRQRADAIPFPLDALPTVLRNMAQAISVTTSTDVGMAGTAMLSAVGYCFTGLYRLAGKADHTEPPVLYSIIIAQPSERKSPVMHFIKAPFDSFESKYNKDHREEMYKAQQDVKALEARVKAMEKEDEPDTTAIAKLRVQAENIRNTTPIRIAVDDADNMRRAQLHHAHLRYAAPSNDALPELIPRFRILRPCLDTLLAVILDARLA